jgi:hypothetical protein
MAAAFPLWDADHHAPGSHAVETQVVAHHQDAVKVARHGPGIHHVPGSHAVDTEVAHRLVAVKAAPHGPDIHRGPGVALHHGHPVELREDAVRSPAQAVPKPPRNSLQGQFFSSSPWRTDTGITEIQQDCETKRF